MKSDLLIRIDNIETDLKTILEEYYESMSEEEEIEEEYNPEEELKIQSYNDLKGELK